MRTERELWVDKVNGGEECDLVIAEPEGEERPKAHAAAATHT